MEIRVTIAVKSGGRGADGAQTNVFARWMSRRTIRRRKPAATADGASTEAPKKRSETQGKRRDGKGRRARRRGSQRAQLGSLLRLNVATDLFAIKKIFFSFFSFFFLFLFTKDSYGDHKPFFLLFFALKKGRKSSFVACMNF